MDSDSDQDFYTELESVLRVPIDISRSENSEHSECIDYKECTIEELVSHIKDFGQGLHQRISSIQALFERSPEMFEQVISDLKNVYINSASSGIEKTLSYIVMETTIPCIGKYHICDTLIDTSEKVLSKEPITEIEEIVEINKNRFIESLKVLDSLCKCYFSELPSPCKINSIYQFVKSTNFFDKSLIYTRQFCLDNFSDDYKYKSLLGIEKNVDKNIKNWDNPVWKRYLDPWIQNKYREKDDPEFIEDMPEPIEFVDYCLQVDKLMVDILTVFLKTESISTEYKILCCQNILSKAFIDTELVCFIEEFLLEIIRKGGNEQLLADVSDILLRYGRENAKAEAQECIMNLGFKDSKDKIKTVFNNQQNVHIKEIGESSEEILEFLTSLPIYKYRGKDVDFKFVYDDLTCKYTQPEYFLESDLRKKVDLALNRIHIDRALYSKFSCSLENILVRVYSYIQNSEFKEELLKRLFEELIDMSGWCSSGFAYRLLNTLSGFGEFNIRISFTDQVISNFSGRFYSEINKVKKEEKKGYITLGFTADKNDNDPETKKARNIFRKFFMKRIPKIREEMYLEFKDYMSDTDYDIAFRKAITQIIEGVKLN